MLKKLAIALTALTFTLAFAGCGGEKKTAEAKDVKPAATTAAVNSFIFSSGLRKVLCIFC